MIRSAVDKVMWMGRATVFMVGLVAILALLFVLAYVALGSLSGDSDQRSGISQQIGSGRADQGLSLETLARRRTPTQGFAQVSYNGPSLTSSKGVIGVQHNATAGLYCFDVSFTPRAAVASAHINNNATVGTVLGNDVPSGCTAPFRDAAAKVYGANDVNSTPHNDVSFGIVFMR